MAPKRIPTWNIGNELGEVLAAGSMYIHPVLYLIIKAADRRGRQEIFLKAVMALSGQRKNRAVRTHHKSGEHKLTKPDAF